MVGEPLILYMDRYHLGDFLFLQALVRSLSVRVNGPPFVICHGSGGAVERLFEGRGLDPRREEGRLVASDDVERALFDRGMRETTRKLTAMLTESVVAAVAISGSDRALLTVRAGNAVEVRDVSWLHELLAKRVIPVISAAARGDGRVVEAPTAPTLAALSSAIGTAGVAVFAKGGVVPAATDPAAPRAIPFRRAVEAGVISEPSVVGELQELGVPTFLVTPSLVASGNASDWPLLTGGFEVRNPPKERRNSILP